MSRAKDVEKALAGLRLFNQAVTTSRLYPAVSPQVTNALEKAFKSAQELVLAYGDLSFGRVAGTPHIWGEALRSDDQQALFELVIYRHLDLLSVDHFRLTPDFDRLLFKKILIIFVSRKEKINREGGGRQFIHNLGLSEYFPESYVAPARPAENQAPATAEAVESSRSMAAPLLVNQPGVDEEDVVLEKLRDDERAAETLVAGIHQLLEQSLADSGERTAQAMTLSASYTRLLDGFDEHLAKERHGPIISRSLQAIFPEADAFLICLLFVQRYHHGFGTTLFNGLCDGCPAELFGDSLELFRKYAAQFTQQKQQDLPPAKLVAATLEKLLETKAGKQMVGRERAQALIKSSEEDRKIKRLQTGVKALLEGDTSSLRSEEIVFKLPATIDELIKAGDQQSALQIIERAAAEMLGGDDELRSRLIQSLILIGENLLRLQRWSWLDKLSGALISWVRESDEGDFVYEKSASLLQEMMKHAWRTDNDQRGAQILTVFHKIRTAQWPKSPPVVALIGRIQDRSVDQAQIASLLTTHLAGDDAGQAGQRLSMLGRAAGNFLIDRLLESAASEERFKIIELLQTMGSVISPLLRQRLPEPMPWYGSRNLIKLIAGLADPTHIDAVVPFLKHQDLRVQREAFLCLYTIGKARRREVLLSCLEQASETLLPQVVKALQPYHDAGVAERLGALLVDQAQFSERIRENLVRQLIGFLEKSDSVSAQIALQTFHQSKKRPENVLFGEDIWQQVAAALAQFQNRKSPTAAGSARQPRPEIAAPRSPQTRQPLIEKPAEPRNNGPKQKDFSRLPGASTVTALLDKGALPAAKAQIMVMIAQAAAQRQFPAAERYREWLIALDSMALTQIIRAAEIIEEEKVAAIDSYDAQTWAELYEVLSTEEFATLYHAMVRKTYKTEELIVKQGSLQSCLYFISSGKVKLFYEDEHGASVLVRIIGAGEIIGAETMFDASVWTVSASCVAHTEMMLLDLEMVNKWRDDMPSLESKLSGFCMSRQSLERFFKKTGKDRRASKRYKLSGRVSNMLLNNAGEETGVTARGDLFDISAGGVSFYVRISHKSHVRLLLGRSTKIVVATKSGVARQAVIKGRIVAVRGHQVMENEYSVHVKFDQNLDATELKAILTAAAGSN